MLIVYDLLLALCCTSDTKVTQEAGSLYVWIMKEKAHFIYMK